MNTKSVSSSTVFKVSLTVNLISVIWNIINDCDETYNYWEPLHFLIYGYGFQTWEYSPIYALRSYLYLIVYGWPAILIRFVFQSIPKPVLFYTIRIWMALVASWLQTKLFASLSRSGNSGEKSRVSLLSLAILLFSPASFISSTALLPSSFSLFCTLFTFSSWLAGDIFSTVASVAVSSIIGWPFAVAIGIPFAIDFLFIQRKFREFLRSALISGVLCVSVSVAVDSYFYGRVTLPSLNIVLYNVFSSRGPDLYGVESIWYYVKNYCLNFHLAVGLVLVSPIVLLVRVLRSNGNRADSSMIDINRVGLMSLAVFVVWNLVFGLQPHKEERFLFPCYPAVAILAAISLESLDRLSSRFIRKRSIFSVGFLVVFSVISCSRIFALVRSFGGSNSLYFHLSDAVSPASLSSSASLNLCLGREWHRFPSHFLVPIDNLNVSFIKSDFRGQLPAKFDESNRLIDRTRLIRPIFNDLNLEQRDRYIDLNRCRFIIDRTDYDVSKSGQTKFDRWQPVLKYRILRPDSVGGRLSIFRSFYVPILSDRFNEFVDYVLLATI